MRTDVALFLLSVSAEFVAISAILGILLATKSEDHEVLAVVFAARGGK